MNKLDLPFDLYTRNFLIAKLVDEVRSRSPLRILAVGGKGGRLNDFLVEDELCTVDIRAPEDDQIENYVLGDIVHAPFTNKSFDIVVASEVYEHIPPKDRLKAISSMFALSKNFSILAAPFYCEEAEEAEKRANNFFLKATGKCHPWLEEHMENTLPLEAELESFLARLDYEFYKLGTNNISNWLLLQLFIFYAFHYQIPPHKIQTVHRFYNENFAELGDLLEPTYRKIYLIAKQGTLPEITSSYGKHVDKFKQQKLTFLVFDAIREGSALRDAQTAELGNALQAKDSQIAELSNSLQARDAQIESLEASLQEKNAQLTELSSTLQAKDSQIRSLEFQIQQGIVMHFVNKYQRVIEKLLRTGTRRRYYYELGLAGIRVILNEGWGSFWFKFRRWLSQQVSIRKIVPGQVDPYQLWISRNEPKAEELERQKQESLSFKYRPKISIITPVWNPEPKWLTSAIESVFNQTYDNWELCLADGNSTKPRVKQVLQDYAKKDSRIKVKFLPENRNISGNSNEALALATGEFIGLLDHDDELAPFALYEVTKLLNKDAWLDIIYSDEDKINTKGNRFAPFFKPDWSPDLLHSSMYTAHLSVYRRQLVQDLGAFRSAYDFSQDYDLALRATEKTSNIAHIPQVLYHWRASPASAAAGAKGFARASNVAALQSAVERRGYRAKAIVAPAPYCVNRIEYTLLDYPTISIIVPTDDRDNIVSCVGSVLKESRYPNFEIVIVTNCSLAEMLVQHYAHEPRVRVIRFDRPFNFSAKCNLGASQARGDFLLFLNDDMEVLENNWIEEMVGFFQRPEVGAVGPKLVYPDGTIQHAGLVTGVRGFVGTAFHGQVKDSFGYFGYIQSTRNVSALSAACLLVPRQLFESVGGFDETNTPIWHSDVDLCFRIRGKGYLLVYTPFTCLKHISHVSVTKTEQLEQAWVADSYLLKRWPSFIASDPYFTKNMRRFLYNDTTYYRIVVNERIALGHGGRNILFVNNDSTSSGPTMLAYGLATYLARRGNFVTVVTPTEGELIDKYKEEGIPVIIDGSIIESPFPFAATRRFLAGYDLVIVSAIFSWHVVLASKQKGVPVLWLVHESDSGKNLAKANPDIIRSLNTADVVVFPSNLTAALYEEFLKADNFEVVPVGTDSSEYGDRVWTILLKRINDLRAK